MNYNIKFPYSVFKTSYYQLSFHYYFIFHFLTCCLHLFTWYFLAIQSKCSEKKSEQQKINLLLCEHESTTSTDDNDSNSLAAFIVDWLVDLAKKQAGWLPASLAYRQYRKVECNVAVATQQQRQHIFSAFFFATNNKNE